MPKEQINTPSIRIVESLPARGNLPASYGFLPLDAVDRGPLKDTQHIEYSPRLFMHWTPGVTGSGNPDEGYMHVSVQVAAHEILRLADEVKRGIAADGGEQLLPDASVDVEVGHLTRTEAQKLIRVTRRARDQVFEGDE